MFPAALPAAASGRAGAVSSCVTRMAFPNLIARRASGACTRRAGRILVIEYRRRARFISSRSFLRGRELRAHLLSPARFTSPESSGRSAPLDPSRDNCTAPDRRAAHRRFCIAGGQRQGRRQWNAQAQQIWLVCSLSYVVSSDSSRLNLRSTGAAPLEYVGVFVGILARRRNPAKAVFSPCSGVSTTGCSAAWLARLTGGQKVGGSNPPSPTSC